MNKRTEKLIGLLHEQQLDAMLVTSPDNRRYLSGFSGSNATLLIHGDGAKLYTDFRYTEQATNECPEYSVCLYDQFSGLYEQLASEIMARGIKRLAYESDKVTVEWLRECEGKLKGVELIAFPNQVDRLRWIKDEQEIEAIQAAQKVTDEAFAHILALLRPGISEIEIMSELNYRIAQQGGGLAFDSIIASGPNSSMPHAQPTARKLQQGDFLTMDFGCKLNGYCSDMTRTVAIGQPSEEMAKIYAIVLEAQRRALDNIAPGVVCNSVDFQARGYIDECGYGGCFGHGLGHSFGLFIHEEPRFSAQCTDVLVPGMCLSVEPGIYLPGKFGVRIEDTVCITEDGLLNFTHSPKDLLIL